MLDSLPGDTFATGRTSTDHGLLKSVFLCFADQRIPGFQVTH
jgi:hypothetical protein